MNHLIEKYNNLKGQKVSRDYLVGFTTELFEFITENETALKIWERIHKVLDTFPDAKNFQFENIDQIKDHGLNGLLDGLEESQIIDDGYNTGLKKAVKPSDIYDMITNRMKELLKKASGSGYIKKWKARVYGEGYLIPFNFVSKKRYRGVNHFLLTDFEPLKNPFFLTFKQVDKLGGKVKKGAKGYEVIYFTKLYKYEQAEPKLEFSTYDKKKMIKFLNDNKDKINLFKIGFTAESIANQSYLPILKYYNVFNGADIEGIDFDLYNFKVGYINNPLPALEENKMPIPEAIIENYPDPKPRYRFGGDRAYYSTGDYIQMPYIVDFETAQDYYRTFFHEIGHSTGAAKRLARPFGRKKGDKKYAFEELVAEWTAVFLSAEAGIVFHTNMNHAEYLKNWNRALTRAKDDNKFIMRACTEAQKAADFVLQFDSEGNPKYLKDLEVKPEKKLPKPTVDLRKINTKAKSYNAIKKFESALKDDIPVSVKLEYESNLKKLKENHIKKYGTLQKKNNKPNLESNPKGFAIKPKSTTVETAIKDVLKLKKYKGEASQRQAKLLYAMFNNDVDVTLEEVSDIEKVTALDRKSNFHHHSRYDVDDYSPDLTLDVELTELGKDFINAVNRRLESLVNQDNNLALFDGLKASVTPIETETIYLNLSSGPIAVEPIQPNVATPQSAPSSQPEPTTTNAQLHVENKPVEETATEAVKPVEVLHLKPKTNKKLPKGFTRANEKINLEALPGLFVLPGEIGKWLQKQQRYRLMILVHGESGAGKSELVKQLSNSFLDAGYTGGFFDLEQGGLISKDTQESIARNIPEKNKVNIAFTDEAEHGLESVKAVADDFDFIVVDSWQKLKEPMNRLDELRIEHPNTIWIIITQETVDGKAKGGSQTVFDPPVRLKSYKVDNDFINNYTEIMKNRGNQNTVGTRYNMYKKQVITEETKPEPKPEKEIPGIVYS